MWLPALQPGRDATVVGAGALPVLAEAVGAVNAVSGGTGWCGGCRGGPVHAVPVDVDVGVGTTRTSGVRCVGRRRRDCCHRGRRCLRGGRRCLRHGRRSARRRRRSGDWHRTEGGRQQGSGGWRGRVAGHDRTDRNGRGLVVASDDHGTRGGKRGERADPTSAAAVAPHGKLAGHNGLHRGMRKLAASAPQLRERFVTGIDCSEKRERRRQSPLRPRGGYSTWLSRTVRHRPRRCYNRPR